MECEYYGTGHITTWKMSKYEVFSGSYFPIFGLNIGNIKYGPEKTMYLDTFHAVYVLYTAYMKKRENNIVQKLHF